MTSTCELPYDRRHETVKPQDLKRITQEVADTEYTADVRELFKQGKKIAEKKPKTLITDGAPNFHEAS